VTTHPTVSVHRRKYDRRAVVQHEDTVWAFDFEYLPELADQMAQSDMPFAVRKAALQRIVNVFEGVG